METLSENINLESVVLCIICYDPFTWTYKILLSKLTVLCCISPLINLHAE